MPLKPEDQQKAHDILDALQGGRTTRWFYGDDDPEEEPLRGNIARVVTSALVVLGSEKPLVGSARREPEAAAARLALFSPSLVLVWDIDDIEADEKSPPAMVARRAAVATLEVIAGAPVVWGDRFDQLQAVQRWPGKVTVRASFDGIPGVVEVTGEGVDRYDLQRRTPVLRLVDGLTADLRGPKGARAVESPA